MRSSAYTLHNHSKTYHVTILQRFDVGGVWRQTILILYIHSNHRYKFFFFFFLLSQSNSFKEQKRIHIHQQHNAYSSLHRSNHKPTAGTSQPQHYTVLPASRRSGYHIKQQQNQQHRSCDDDQLCAEQLPLRYGRTGSAFEQRGGGSALWGAYGGWVCKERRWCLGHILS